MNSTESLAVLFELIKSLISVETIILLALIFSLIKGTWLYRAAHNIESIKLGDKLLKFYQNLPVTQSTGIATRATEVASDTDAPRYTPLNPAGAQILAQYFTPQVVMVLRYIAGSSNTQNSVELGKTLGSVMPQETIITSLLSLLVVAFVDLDHNLRFQPTERGLKFLTWLAEAS